MDICCILHWVTKKLILNVQISIIKLYIKSKNNPQNYLNHNLGLHMFVSIQRSIKIILQKSQLICEYFDDGKLLRPEGGEVSFSLSLSHSIPLLLDSKLIQFSLDAKNLLHFHGREI